MNHRRQPFEPPAPYSIQRGIISRIESFGAFVKLVNSPITGLVHISQLHSSKVDNVNDVVELDMDVFVKVMEVSVETYEDESGRQRQRHRVKLSMKYVDQDSGKDLDPDNTQMEQDLFRSGGNRSRNFDEGGGTGGADSTLGRALASNIGMSSAIDPGNLVLKGKQTGGTASFNGYALVGEHEGEDLSSRINETQKSEPLKPAEEKMIRPMGRGRGTTLPAWMTRNDGEDKLGSMKQSNGDHSRNSDESDDESYRRRKSSKRRKKDRDRHHKSNKKHRHKSSRRKDRSTSISRSRSRSWDRKRSHKHSRRSRRNDRYSRSRSRSSGRYSRSRSDSSGRCNQKPGPEFASVEEARAIMERLERQRGER